MANLILERSNTVTDAKKYKKDCADFECLPDGTLVGECKYCKKSLICRQIDFDRFGNPVPMEAHYLPIIDIITGHSDEHQLFCTGIVDRRPLNERVEDDKVS